MKHTFIRTQRCDTQNKEAHVAITLIKEKNYENSYYIIKNGCNKENHINSTRTFIFQEIWAGIHERAWPGFRLKFCTF